MQTCPACGDYNRPSDQTCVKCGAKISDVAAAGGLVSAPAPSMARSPFPLGTTPQPDTPGTAASGSVARLEPYKLSGRVGSGALAIVISILGAALVGVVYQLVSGINKMFLISELLGGLFVGLAVGMAVRSAKVRNLSYMLVLAAAASLVAFGVYQIAQSQVDRPVLVRMITADIAQKDNVSSARVRPVIEQRLTPWQTLKLDLEVRAASGVTLQDTALTSVSANSGGTTSIQGGTYYAFLVLQALIFMIVAGGFGFLALSLPFCENCKKWMDHTAVLHLHPGQAPRVLGLVNAQQWDLLVREQPTGKVDLSSRCDVGVYYCSACPEGTIKVELQIGNRMQTIAHLVLPTGVADYLRKPVVLPSIARIALPPGTAPPA